MYRPKPDEDEILVQEAREQIQALIGDDDLVEENLAAMAEEGGFRVSQH